MNFDRPVKIGKSRWNYAISFFNYWIVRVRTVIIINVRIWHKFRPEQEVESLECDSDAVRRQHPRCRTFLVHQCVPAWSLNRRAMLLLNYSVIVFYSFYVRSSELDCNASGQLLCLRAGITLVLDSVLVMKSLIIILFLLIKLRADYLWLSMR